MRGVGGSTDLHRGLRAEDPSDAGRIADGVIMLVGSDLRFIHAAWSTVEVGATEVGRSLSDLDVVLGTPTASGDDGWVARGLVRADAARVVIRPVPAAIDPAQLGAVELIRESYDYYHDVETEADEASDVTDDLIDLFALAGTPTECAERLATIACDGIDQVAIVPFVGSGGERADTVGAFAQLFGPVWPQRTKTAARDDGGRAGRSQRVRVRVVAFNRSKTSVGRIGM